MRSDVSLIGPEGPMTISTPDLLGVFRAAQRQSPLSLRSQIYFNSWTLSGLFYHVDANAHLVMRKLSPAVDRSLELIRYATEPANLVDLEDMGISEQRTTLYKQTRLVRLFSGRLSKSPYEIPRNILTLGYTGRLFNDLVNNARELYQKKRNDNHGPLPARNPFAVTQSPFIVAHFAAHMMNLIGERFDQKKETENLSFMYKSFIHDTQSTVPLGTMTPAEAGESSAAAAVGTLRVINQRLQEVLKAPHPGLYLPEKAKNERRLVEELFIFTKPYREYIPPRKPAQTPDADILSMDDWRTRLAQKRQHAAPAPD